MAGMIWQNEHKAKANVVATPSIEALRTCSVSFIGSSGIRHSLEVTAESLYEAAAVGLNMLRQRDWADQIAPGTVLEVRVTHPKPARDHRAASQMGETGCRPEVTVRKRRLKPV